MRLFWRDDRVAEGARLLSGCAPNTGTEGSNPSLSARWLWEVDLGQKFKNGRFSAARVLRIHCAARIYVLKFLTQPPLPKAICKC